MSPSRLVRPFGRSGVEAPTAEQAASFDRVAIEERSVPEPALMENAGRQAALLIHHLYPKGLVAAVVGSGNNGGDALVCLRALAAWGRSVRPLLVSTRPPDDPVLHGWNLDPWVMEGSGAAGEELRVRLGDASVVVDGVLGTGIRGAPRAAQAAAIEGMNAGPGPVVALDTPSGVDGSTGKAPGAAVQAELTLAFGWPKLGTLLHPGRARAGRIVAVEIGFPPNPDSGWAALITPGWAAERLPRRDADTHKNRVGSLCLIAGSAMPGAAVLAARSAFRSGVGLVRVCGTAALREVLLAALPEALFVSAEGEGDLEEAVGQSDALAVGPGLGTDDGAASQLDRALAAREGRPAVLDADALTLVSRGGTGGRAALGGGGVVVTPHPGEMERLSGSPLEAVQEDRPGAARAFAAATGAVTVLKGTPALVADGSGGLLVATVQDTSDLAVAGMGDVLTGAIGAFLAQGTEPRVAAGLGLHVSGRAAADCALGPSLTPSDVIERLPAALGYRGPGETDLPFPFVTFDQDAPR